MSWQKFFGVTSDVLAIIVAMMIALPFVLVMIAPFVGDL